MKASPRKTSKHVKADPAANLPKPSRRRLWLFRVAVLILAPLLVLVLLESGLRLAGFGYKTCFLLPFADEHGKLFVQNNQFAWRFFGRQMARTPTPFAIPQQKAPKTIRIFVFGESAANGDPQPRFGLPRMIEALLNLRHPGTRFEVVNAAMTGINSHAVLPIARDCARADGDVWVVYMGNNEVVGPFGAGTVFGSQAPPLPLVRATLAVKTTATGQWLDSIRQQIQKPPPEKSEWGGMTMFLEQQVRADDPRMKAVYHHFERNLADIIETGRRNGAGIVVSTVAVNLKDCAPFASAFRPNLSETDKTKWKELYQSGVVAQSAGKNKEATEWFHQAAAIDDSVAELHFRQASCALASGDIPAAQQNFRVARDLDTLRFRCDSRLNDTTRRIASDRERDRILLVDSEKAFADQSPDGLPGRALFYEHVHLTFEGNYLLARTIVPQIETLLPENPPGSVGGAWPSIADCARRLAWNDRNRLSGLSDILTRLADPPFTGQIDHDSQVQYLTRLITTLASATQPVGMSETTRACEAAIAGAPDDAWLHGELASLKQSAGDLPGAETETRRALELIPGNASGWSDLGHTLVQQEKFDAAANAFRRAVEWDSQDVWAVSNLAHALAKLGRRDEAIRQYRRALEIKPRFGLAWLGLGQLLEEMGNKAEADDCYRKALANRIHRAAELAMLARFCQSRSWFDAAVTNYVDAIKLDPLDASLHLGAAQSLASLGRREEAGRHYADAARLAPDMMEAHFLLGLELGRQGDSAGAAAHFQEAVRIRPDLVEARLNLGVALAKLGRNPEALAEFDEVLRRNPTNALALREVEVLRSRTTP